MNDFEQFDENNVGQRPKLRPIRVQTINVRPVSKSNRMNIFFSRRIDRTRHLF